MLDGTSVESQRKFWSGMDKSAQLSHAYVARMCHHGGGAAGSFGVQRGRLDF